ncbi:MAG: ABC transporter permease subunit, partial [Acidimicrobiia bacterium]|nr:ABC transporter permease subunit [Acidimicrobiia bacterium]
GDFGISRSDAPIGTLISGRLLVTLPLVMTGMLVATFIAVPLGTLAALHNRRPLGTVLSVVSQIGIAIPAFWMGILLITWVAVRWGLLPAGNFPTAGWDDLGGAVRSLILPVIVLGLAQGAVLMRYVRSATLEVLNADFVRTARAKGMTRGEALRRHGLRNAAIPVITVLGLQLATLMIGAVVIEQVFTLPGLGRLLLDGVGNRDIPQVQGIVLVITALVLLINFVVDVLYRVVDPRLRISR